MKSNHSQIPNKINYNYSKSCTILPQFGAYISQALSLLKIYSIQGLPTDLVRTSIRLSF